MVGGDAFVTGWIDWNKDGDFEDSGEQIFTNEDFSTDKTRTIVFAIPAGTTFGTTFNARFRLYGAEQTAEPVLAAPAALAAAPSPSGGATGGEVEDYTWSFSPNAVTLTDLAVTGASGVGWPVAVALGAVGCGLLAWRRRK